MDAWLDAILILMVLLGLFIIGSNRLGTMIKIFGLQSFILGTVPLVMYSSNIEFHVILVAVVAIVARSILMPYFLFWAIRHVSIRSEVNPTIGVGATLFLSGFAIIGSFWLSSKLMFPEKMHLTFKRSNFKRPPRAY